MHITLLSLNPKRTENMHLFHGRNKNIPKAHQEFPECFHFPATNLLKGKHLVMHTTLWSSFFVEAVAEVLETQNTSGFIYLFFPFL